MDQKKTRLAVVLCVALFAVALVLAVLFSGASPQTNTSAAGGVVISEVMASNRTYPDGQGRYLDYIEVYNPTGSAIDISNYKLSDDEATIGYTFPQGTVLPAYGYAVCWCDSEDKSGEYASFQISKDGGETVYLYNSANVLIDQQTVPTLGTNNPYVRNADGTWSVGGAGSPGYANTAEGNQAWLRSKGVSALDIIISEVQTANYCVALGTDGVICDWVELYNGGTAPVDLSGMFLSDDPADPLKWQIKSLTIQPGGYALIRCGGPGENDAGFSLERGGCTLLLTGTMGQEVARLQCPELNKGAAWAIQEDDNYTSTVYPTPGYENTTVGYSQWLDAMGVVSVNVVISEVQTANRSAILDSRGRLCDWVELYNAGSTAADLSGAFLSDDLNDHIKWQIPSLVLEPGERAIIKCVGTGAAEGEASFALAQSGTAVILSGAAGNIISQTEVPTLLEDRTWQLLEDGTYAETALISPGYENTEEGHKAFRASQGVLGALAISEVMPSNNRYLIQSDGEYYDWVELKNISDSPIELSEYYISGNGNEPLLFQLPQRTLQPGQSIVIICSGNTELTGTYIHANFTLNREESWLYVSHGGEGFSDYIRISDVPYQGSVGRMDGQNGVFYFSTPTPGKANNGGIATIADAPFVETPGGVYDDVTGVSVVLSGEGQIRYTTDGSEPTVNSKLYTEPLYLTNTTTIRAACFSEGKLQSETVTTSYIINENHTLPVLSISVDPNAMFGYSGIYTQYYQDREIPCNVTLFENGEGFSIDCGIKMHGHTGLQNPKKSFKINFRGCYGENVLSYPVYGEDGPEIYESMCIRAGQDYLFAIFREELFTSLCQDMSDTVLTQRSKYCILYINGQYFGIYSLKEAFSEMYYAQNRDVSEESVEMVQAPVWVNTDLYRFMTFLQTHDMTLEENYEYACSVMNMDSLIDWMIIQGYSTNGDVQQNLRYFRSTENGNTYELALYDLDWAFYYHLPFTDILSNDRSNWQHLKITCNLIENPTFRQKFLERLSYHMQNTLSTENVLAKIDYFQELLAPEVPREKARWGGSYSSWANYYVARLRSFITNTDHLADIVNRLDRYINLTQEEIDTYFWRWV